MLHQSDDVTDRICSCICDHINADAILARSDVTSNNAQIKQTNGLLPQEYLDCTIISFPCVCASVLVHACL